MPMILAGIDSRQRRQRVDAALASVNLLDRAEHRPNQLSGGQLQRVRFARLALQDAPIILLDEPYTGIDAATVRDLAFQVTTWNTEGRTVVAVLHDLDHVREVAETVMPHVR